MCSEGDFWTGWPMQPPPPIPLGPPWARRRPRADATPNAFDGAMATTATTTAAAVPFAFAQAATPLWCFSKPRHAHHYPGPLLLLTCLLFLLFAPLGVESKWPTPGEQHHHHSRPFSQWNLVNQTTAHRHHHKRHSSSSGDSSVTPSVASKTYVTSNKSINFTHVELDSVTGTIYVGAVNWVFQLNADSLRVEHAVRTGPIRDSVACAPSDCAGVDASLVQVSNNLNKVLLVEPYARMLIVCGSVHQGACARHRLEDISQHEDLVPLPVSSNDENSTTLAFVGPARYFGVQLTPILYVASTDSRLGPYRDMVPAIAGRSLESGPRLFQIIERSFADSARVDISSNLRDYFTVRYLYGFYANEYVYFAQVQRKSYLRALEELGYVTRLARVCVSDAGFHTYTEVTLQCFHEAGNHRRGPNRWSSGESPSGEVEEFNLLQDAILVKAGNDLADSLLIERGSQVLVGVFSASYDHTHRAGDKSALCVFPIADIEQSFAENIHLCYNGSVYSRNMDYIAGSVNQCPEPGAANVFNFCNEAVKLNGSIPLRSEAAIVYRGGTKLTAVTAAITGQHTVAFLGTHYGSVKKVLLQRGDYGEQFDEVIIDSNQPILADLFVDSEVNPRHLIAASPYKVAKVPVESCVQHDSCDQCLQARNPYCGWCSLQKRCTIKSDCVYPVGGGVGGDQSTFHFGHPPTQSSLFSTPRWLSLETSQCIDFQAIKPEFMPRDLLSPVELIINQLPPLPYGANYLCVFEGGSPIPATVTRNGLTCQTPPLALRPPIPSGQDHVSVNVAVRSSETDTDFIHRSFMFFDCSVHKSCKSCVISAWNCNWCMHENLCTYNTSLCTRRVIVGENSPQNSLVKGAQHCPSFAIEHEILIPNQARRELRVEVRNLIPSQDGFQCIVEIEQAKERVPARVRDNNIICNEIMLSYQDEVGEQNASLTVLWNGDTFIDHTNFTIYKCQFLGAHAGRADCSLCQTRDAKYGCVWCFSQCAFVDQCSETPLNTCPPPRIDYIHPISGPLEGGTLVSIEGSNLGSSFDEIKERVSIGGIPCEPIEYNVSIRIICRTGPSPIGPQSALVVIGNRAGVTRAQEKFQYKSIELTDVSPKIGPQSGGSRIYLSGKNLNIGSHVAVYLDDLPCFVERALASSYQLSCRTTAAPYPSYVVSQLTLVLDGANFTLTNPFLYTLNPTVSRIEPLQSFFSGGRILQVFGSHFTSVQQARILVFVRRGSRSTPNLRGTLHSGGVFPTAWPPYSSRLSGTEKPATGETPLIDTHRLINESICTVMSSNKMLCPSPTINGDLQTLAAKLSHQSDWSRDLLRGGNTSTLHHIPDQIYLQIGFLMDDTISVLELDTYYPHLDSNILYVADPVIYSLNNGHGKSVPVGQSGNSILPFKSDILVIEGENLSVLPLADNEMNVTIGTHRCNLTSISMRQIVCQPPILPPPPTDELGRRGGIQLPAVVLRIGNLRRHLGYLHYGGEYPLSGFDSVFRTEDGSFDPQDESSRFYQQNHPVFGYGNRFNSVSSVNVELLIGILILTGTVLAIISIIVLAAYKHKTTEAEREYKRIQLQMDTLESNVRSECKQAFAELQTDILQASGLFSVEEMHRITLPTHDERTFLLRMFFTSIPTYNWNESDQAYNASIDSGIYKSVTPLHTRSLVGSLSQLFWNTSPYFSREDRHEPYQGPPMHDLYTSNRPIDELHSTVISQFKLLVLNRTFLLALVSTLERQKTFSLNDRIRFGSLLMLALLDKMEYAFDVMRHLLEQLIDRLASKHPQQVIPRTDSVVETMLVDWLSICMFKYAKEVSSGPLFLLFSAIKHQIDKGPVDFVTGNSRYSLSEERLLREQIEYKTISVMVFVDEKLQPTLPSRSERLRADRPQTSRSKTRKSEDEGEEVGDTGQPASAEYPEKVDESEGHQCRVLDCDTISQVKAKLIDSLYRCVPHSQRPQVAQVSLYWRCLKPKPLNPMNGDKLTTPTPNSGSVATTCTTVKNVPGGGGGGSGEYHTEGSSSSDHSQAPPTSLKHQPISSNSSSVVSTAAATASLLQDVYVAASLISAKNDPLEKIYNASRRSDVSMEMTDMLLEDYDHSTQILTANEAIWRRLNTISHYGITDGAILFLCLRPPAGTPAHNPAAFYGDQASLLYGAGGPVTGKRSVCAMYSDSVSPRVVSKLVPEDQFRPAVSTPYVVNRYQFQGSHPGGETYEDEVDEEDDRMDANYHLYESIPAVLNSAATQEAALYPMMRETIYGPSSGLENVYNLSNASSAHTRPKSNQYGQYNPGGSTARYSICDQMQAQQSYDFYNRATPSSRQEELYGVNCTRSGNNSLLYQATGSVSASGAVAALSPNNYSQRLLMQTSTNSPMRMRNNPRRSFARNVYDRLSLFVKGSRRHSGFAKNHRLASVANPSDQRHNIWHLVKPSSLIADCIIGASGSFLYEDSADLLSGKTRLNLRTMRQRRALRRRRTSKPFGGKGNSSSSQLAAAASAALSASQMNLNQLSSGQATPPVFGSASRPRSPFSFLTNSASSLFSTLFAGSSQPTGESLSTLLFHKSIPEIYLTRLLTTKGTIQQYVDDFFGTIFTVNDRLPIAVKWLFDFFDHQATKNSINESETVHLWKSNSLILRFWITLLRTPEILFDIRSTVSIDVCLEVLAQSLIDASNNQFTESATSSSHRLGKDSPPSKLLSARDIPNYQAMIRQYYNDIAMLPSIKESDIMAYMNDVSKTFEGKIHKENALEELLYYCLEYKDAIFATLAADPAAQHEHLHLRFETIVYSASSLIHQTSQQTSNYGPQTSYMPSGPSSGISRV